MSSYQPSSTDQLFHLKLRTFPVKLILLARKVSGEDWMWAWHKIDHITGVIMPKHSTYASSDGSFFLFSSKHSNFPLNHSLQQANIANNRNISGVSRFQPVIKLGINGRTLINYIVLEMRAWGGAVGRRKVGWRQRISLEDATTTTARREAERLFFLLKNLYWKQIETFSSAGAEVCLQASSRLVFLRSFSWIMRFVCCQSGDTTKVARTSGTSQELFS